MGDRSTTSQQHLYAYAMVAMMQMPQQQMQQWLTAKQR